MILGCADANRLASSPSNMAGCRPATVHMSAPTPRGTLTRLASELNCPVASNSSASIHNIHGLVANFSEQLRTCANEKSVHVISAKRTAPPLGSRSSFVSSKSSVSPCSLNTIHISTPAGNDGTRDAIALPRSLVCAITQTLRCAYGFGSVALLAIVCVAAMSFVFLVGTNASR